MITRRYSFIAIALVISFFIASCSNQGARDYEKALSEIQDGHFRIALSSLDKIIKRYKNEDIATSAAREAAKLAFYEVKDFKRSLNYYQVLVLSSKDHEERLNAQRQIALIYFDHINDYKKSIIEYNKLLEMAQTFDEKVEIRLKISRANYHLNNFYQSESEVDFLLKSPISEEQKFECLMIKANIYLGQKDLEKAAEMFQEILGQFPKRAMQDNVGLTLAVAYEEQQDYKSAIKILESMIPYFNPKEYLELRVKRMKERQSNAPGAKGFRK
jgi:tetratricopeptide (TPR) repeat protein